MINALTQSPMHARIRTFSLIALLGCFLGGLSPARAQAPVQLESLQIALWPEFDRAGVLVLMDGVLDPDTSLPAELTLQLPVEPSAVAELAPDGSLMNAQFVTTAAAQGYTVKLSLQQPSFRVEYYDPSLTVTGAARTYAYAWQAPVAIGSASLRVQQPAGATDLTLTPDFGASAVGEYGLSYYQLSLGALAPNAPLAATLSYNKTGTSLTIDQVDTAPASAPVATLATSPTAAPVVDNNSLALAAAVAAAALAIVAGYLLIRGRRSAQPARSTVRRSRRPARAQTASPSTAAVAAAPRKFCTQCGQPVSGDDRFCRSCGAPVQA